MQRVAPPYTLYAGFELVKYVTPSRTGRAFEVTITHLPEQYCPRCGVNHPVRSVKRVRQIHDVPYNGHPIILMVQEGYWRCPITKKRQPMQYELQMPHCTDGLAHYLHCQRGRKTVRELAQEVGISPATVVRIQREFTRFHIKDPPPERVKRLGLDDIYIQKSQHLIAVDLETNRVLGLQRVGNVTEGRAGQIDVATFLASLPEADLVALDLHAGQFEAAKKRWPEATLVVDKRHLLAVIDREVLAQAARVILDWNDEEQDRLSSQRVISKFGAAAYPYLSLRTLVLRRRRSLTPADHVAWAMLRREAGNEAQILWQMYLFREELYDIYDHERRNTDALTDWLSRVIAWQRKNFSKDSYRQPLGRICWAFETYPDACTAYLRTGVTNAATERANARVRRVLRQGHRFDVATLIELVNREAEQVVALESHTVVTQQPEPEPVPSSVPVIPPRIAIQSASGRPASSRPLKVPKPDVEPTLPSPPRVANRHLKKQHPELGLPRPVWIWMHSAITPGKRGGQRWAQRLLLQAPLHLRGQWSLLSAGQIIDSEGLEVPETVRLLWRTTVLHEYLCHQLHEFSPRVREWATPHADIMDLWQGAPHLCEHLQNTLLALSAERFLPPTELDVDVLRIVRWGQRADAAAKETVTSIFDQWCSGALASNTGASVDLIRRVRPRLPHLSQGEVLALVRALRWLVATELAHLEQPLSTELAPSKAGRAAAFAQLWQAWPSDE